MTLKKSLFLFLLACLATVGFSQTRKSLPKAPVKAKAKPAAVIKGLGHGVFLRIIRADVDIKTVFNMPERAPKHDVFKILRVAGKDHWFV